MKWRLTALNKTLFTAKGYTLDNNIEHINKLTSQY